MKNDNRLDKQAFAEKAYKIFSYAAVEKFQFYLSVSIYRWL